jgi:hypothetical protein
MKLQYDQLVIKVIKEELKVAKRERDEEKNARIKLERDLEQLKQMF